MDAHGNGVDHLAIIQHDWHDKAYIAARVEGFEALQAEVLSPAYAPDKVALVTGVPAEQVIELALDCLGGGGLSVENHRLLVWIPQ